MTKDNTFFFLNSHGTETEELYTIPNGIRIIMFCYSKILDVGNCFDEFNWSHILLNPKASKNYKNFIEAISKYSTIRDHFCVYEQGEVIRDIKIYGDKYFRDGLFRLPVKGYVYDDKNDTIILSEGTMLSEIYSDPVLNKFIKKSSNSHIKVDSKSLVKLVKNKKRIGIFKSFIKTINSEINLSTLISNLKKYSNDFTILLMICRNGNKFLSYDGVKLSKGKNIKNVVL